MTKHSPQNNTRCKRVSRDHHPLLHGFEISSVDPELLLLPVDKEKEEISICSVFFKHHVSAHGHIGRIRRQSAITNCLFISVADSHQSLHADKSVYTGNAHSSVVGSEKKECAYPNALSYIASKRHASVGEHTRRNNLKKRKMSSRAS